MNTRRRRIRRLILRWLTILIGVYLAICLLLFLLQGKLLYYPYREMEGTPADVKLEFEDVTFEAADGVKLHGWFVPAPDERAVVLFCHGNAGNISHRLDSVRIFHNLGLSTFLFDYRGYGKSEGKPSEQGTRLDAEAAWRWLSETHRVSAERIILFGRSLGGAVAAHLAGKHTPRALIVESAFTSVADRAQEMWPLFPVRAICRFEYDTERTVRNVHCPLLVIHSGDDTLIPVHHGRKVFEAANEPKTFLEITGSHNSGFLTSGKTYTDGLRGFIEDHAAP